MKDRYIHYEKAGDQFVGRCVTGIFSLGKYFATLPVYWDTKGAAVGLRRQIDECTSNNFGTIEELEGKTFELSRFYFHQYLITVILWIFTFIESITYDLYLCSLLHHRERCKHMLLLHFPGMKQRIHCFSLECHHMS